MMRSGLLLKRGVYGLGFAVTELEPCRVIRMPWTRPETENAVAGRRWKPRHRDQALDAG